LTTAHEEHFLIKKEFLEVLKKYQGFQGILEFQGISGVQGILRVSRAFFGFKGYL